MFADGSSSESPSDVRVRSSKAGSRNAAKKASKNKSKDIVLEKAKDRGRNRRNCGEVGRENVLFGNFEGAQSGANVHQYPTRPTVVPPGWMMIPVPCGQSYADGFDYRGGFVQGNLNANFQTVPEGNRVSREEVQVSEQGNIDNNTASRSSSVKEESVKKRIRRAKRKDADQEAKRRASNGQKPYSVQVRPSGIIDSGCTGHLKWQSYVRDLTPRMLDLSIISYEDQSQSSRDKLWESLRTKFEFIDYAVTQDSFDKMIKTWLRRERERVRKTSGHCVKAPGKFTDQQWSALRSYWESTGYKQKSDRMTQTRSKVVFHHRTGRHGYAGKDAKMVSEIFP